MSAALSASGTAADAPWGAFTSPSTWSPDPSLGELTLVVLPDGSLPSRDGALALAPGAASIVAPGALAVPMAPRVSAVALTAEAAAAAVPGAAWRPWREFARGGALAPDVEAAVRAGALLAWHRAARHWGVDGSPTAPADDGRRRVAGGGGASRPRTLYPRVDPVAIVLCVSADGERALLGRQAAWPPRMFSCIAGFVELGESAECAALRELQEETGVRAARAALVASQAWPAGRAGGAELMLACVAVAVDAAAEAVDVGHAGDAGGAGELSEARWFSREEVRAMVDGEHAGGLSAPPRLAIAHALMRRWASGALAAP